MHRGMPVHAACTIPHSFNESPLILDQKLLPLFSVTSFCPHIPPGQRNRYIVGDVK